MIDPKNYYSPDGSHISDGRVVAYASKPGTWTIQNGADRMDIYADRLDEEIPIGASISFKGGAGVKAYYRRSPDQSIVIPETMDRPRFTNVDKKPFSSSNPLVEMQRAIRLMHQENDRKVQIAEKERAARIRAEDKKREADKVASATPELQDEVDETPVA